MKAEDKVTFGIAGLMVLGALIYVLVRFKSNIDVCRAYYPQLSLISCMMSDKTIALPKGQP